MTYYNMDNIEKSEAERMQDFLTFTQKNLDKYFGELGYVCLIFKKETHKGQSVFITNSTDDVIKILEPYANAKDIAESKVKKKMRKQLRRVK